MAEFAGVGQAYRLIALRFEVVDLALVEGPGVDVECDRSGGEGRRVDQKMNWLAGINLGGVAGVDDVAVRRGEFTEAGRGVQTDDVVVLHLYLAKSDTHPAALIRVVVNPALVPDLPTESHEIKERRVEDEISSVVVGVEVEVGVEARNRDGIVAHVFENCAVGELLLRDFAKPGGESADIDHVSQLL